MKVVRKYRVELVKESSMKYNIDTTMDSSSKVATILREVLRVESWHNEKFGMAALNTQNKLIGLHIVSEGTIGETAIYPREVATRAILNNASSVILFHNHPGGSTKPSMADIAGTKKIKEALDTLQIKLIDHIIITEDDYTSFAEKGLL